MSRKSTTASSSVLKYIFKYVLDDRKIEFENIKLHHSQKSEEKFLIRHNIRSKTIRGFIKEFDKNETYRLVRRRDSVKVFHTCISFSPLDRELISDAALKDIALKFIKEHGTNSLYIGTKHEDKEHLHLHICHSGTQLNGRSARISKNKFYSIKLELDRYQREKYPLLVHSLPNHNKSIAPKTERLVEMLKANRCSIKAELVTKLEEAYKKSQSKSEFLDHIAASGTQVYMRNGKIQGIYHEGKTKFRFAKLGFDDERMNALDVHKLENTIEQFNNLRKGKQAQNEYTSVNKEVDRTENEKQDSEQLQQLSAIRNKGREKESEYEVLADRVREHNEASEEDKEEISPFQFVYSRSKRNEITNSMER